jgi:Response regulators consisting of a CheY-like receiver domain and a winged-helix DNA-binding domain
MSKILLVDDELHNRILLQELLEDFEETGTSLLYAADGPEALALIRRERPALVFLDVMLPEMDGFDVCRAVKDDPGLAGVFIVLLTARGQEADKAKAAEAKADLYITKPFKTKAILEVARRVLGSPGAT